MQLVSVFGVVKLKKVKCGLKWTLHGLLLARKEKLSVRLASCFFFS